MKNINNKKEFVDPITELKWTPVGPKEEVIIYRDEDSGTYCRMIRSQPGFGEEEIYEEGKGCCMHEFNEVVYIVTGGGINTRLRYRYKPGTIGVFPHRVSHGPLVAPFGRISLEFRHYIVTEKRNEEGITKTKEFLDPISELVWETEGVQEKGASEAMIYRDEDTGTHCRMLKLPEGFGEGGDNEFFSHQFDEVIFIVSGGLINRKLGHRYQPGSIGVFPAGLSHGPFEAPLGGLLLQFRHNRKKGEGKNIEPKTISKCCS